MRREEVAEVQRFQRPGQCRDPVRHRLRGRLPRLHPEFTSVVPAQGVRRVLGRPDRYRRDRFTAERGQGPVEGQGALWRRGRVEPARGVRTDRDHLQRGGVDSLVLDGPTAAKIFSGAVSSWDAPEIAAPQRRHVAAGRAGRGDLPQRRVRHHRQLPAVPRRRLLMERGKRAPAKPSTAAPAKAPRQRGHVRGVIDHARFDHHHNEWSFAKNQGLSSPRSSPRRAPTRLRCPSIRREVDPTASRSRARATTLVLDTTSFYQPTETGAYPRSCSPPTRWFCSEYPRRRCRSRHSGPPDGGNRQTGADRNGTSRFRTPFKGKLATAVNAIS